MGLSTCTGPCKEECKLQIYPTIANGDACRVCGEQHAIWHNKSYAGLDLVSVVNYTRHSMLIGTTITTFARDVTKALHSAGIPVSCYCWGAIWTTVMCHATRSCTCHCSMHLLLATQTHHDALLALCIKIKGPHLVTFDAVWHLQVFCFALDYEPQPIAATIAPYKPLAPLALKADAWEISFTVCSQVGILWSRHVIPPLYDLQIFILHLLAIVSMIAACVYDAQMSSFDILSIHFTHCNHATLCTANPTD